MNVESPCL